MLAPLALFLMLSRPAAAADPAPAADACAPSQAAWESDDLSRKVAENSHTDPCFQQEHRWVLKGFDPTGPATPPACDNEAIWRQVRRAYMDALGADPDNPVARSAAAFLTKSTVPLSTEYMFQVYGTFDTTNPTISLDKDRFEALWASLDGWSRFAERLQPVVEQTESPMVHEVAHARAYEALGDLYPFAEDELVAYGDQALFLRVKLRRDPGYMDLGKIDDAMSSALGETSVFAAKPWWSKALSAEVIERAKTFTPEVRRRLGVTTYQTNDWFLVRSMAGGLKAFEANAGAAGTVAGESVFADHRAFQERMTKPREHDSLPVMIDCRDRTTSEGLRRYLTREIALVQRRRAVWYAQESFRRQESYYRSALERQQKQWAATQAP